MRRTSIPRHDGKKNLGPLGNHAVKHLASVLQPGRVQIAEAVTGARHLAEGRLTLNEWTTPEGVARKVRQGLKHHTLEPYTSRSRTIRTPLRLRYALLNAARNARVTARDA
jgi:hypothetical protein